MTVAYRLLATGQKEPALQDSLKSKAKADGEDVMTPLLLKAAEAVLTQVAKDHLHEGHGVEHGVQGHGRLLLAAVQ